MEVESGTQLHLVLLTSGDGGVNADSQPDLGARRLEEWRRSGQLIGASSQTYLGYQDGLLSNNSMQEISEKITALIGELGDEADEIELMSFEFGGLSGHIDHIVAARAAALSFCRLKADDSRIKRLRLFCLPKSLRPNPDARWIFAEAGFEDDQIDQKIDARRLKQQIEAVMDVHASQATDAAMIKRVHGDSLGLNWFQIIE